MRFIPREEKFFDLFDSAARCLAEAVGIFRDTLDRYERLDLATIRIKELEHEGDKITHDTMDKLNKTFITPIDREDIHDIISRLDDVLDYVDATIHRMLLYKVSAPTKFLKDQTDVLGLAVREVGAALQDLRNLKNPTEILHHCIEINRLENEGDVLLRQAVASLFQNAKDPIEVIKWKEIYENVETAIDRCEDIANAIESVVVKNA
ncbi:MAG: DUF47 domain-containing protein [Planctomycetes bacterium]|nr:DUF47 domain-containing protein [Planctomycetota bacterium]MBI3843487.1 DUF47 domain-containing protein [Planctomycetota bacterium]